MCVTIHKIEARADRFRLRVARKFKNAYQAIKRSNNLCQPLNRANKSTIKKKRKIKRKNSYKENVHWFRLSVNGFASTRRKRISGMCYYRHRFEINWRGDYAGTRLFTNIIRLHVWNFDRNFNLTLFIL